MSRFLIVPYLWRNQFSPSFFLFRKVGVTKNFLGTHAVSAVVSSYSYFWILNSSYGLHLCNIKGPEQLPLFFLNRRFSDLQKDIKLHGLNKTRIYIVISGAASFSGL